MIRRQERVAAGPCGTVWFLLVAVGMCGCGTLGKPSEPLRTVAGITRLREGELDAGQRVALRGVITLLDPGWHLLAIEDESGGVLVEWPPLPANLRVGDRVEVTGATAVDNHVPSVVAASLRVVGIGSLPHPQPVSADSLACGSDLYRFVEVEIKPEEGSLGDDVHTAHFALRRPCGRLEVIGRLFRQYAPASLAGRRLRVRGVPLAFYSPAGAIDHVRLMFDDESDVDILEQPVKESSLTAARPGVLPEIRSVKATKELSNAEAGRGYPVRAEGVVTALNSRFDGYFLQDGLTGIFVVLSRTQGSMPRFGQRVRLSGVTEKGGFAPIIRQTSLEALGRATWPEPAKIEPGDIFHGWEENRWVELEGVGAAVITDGRTHQLELFAGPRRLLVWFSEGDSPDRLQPLINARVAVRGVYSPLYTVAGELSGFRIFTTSPEMVKVLDPAEAVCDSRTIASLSQFDVRGAPQRRFRTAGVVTYRDTRGRLYLQDGDAALRVIGNGPGDPPLGTWATAEGFLSPDSAAPQMEHVRWLSAEPGSAIAPAHHVAESLVSGDLDGRLLAVEGFLESRRTVAGELQLSLLAGRLRFAATMEAPGSSGDFPHLRPGALLRLTGVCATVPSSSFGGTRLATLALRDANDIAVLRRAPWWDLRRAAYAAFAASLLLIAALAVVVRLRQNLVAQMALRSKLEEQLLHSQKLESVGRLAGGVAHDFNNLLTVINGYSDLLLNRMRLGSSDRASMEQIHTAGQRAAELTQKLLAFSRKQLAQPKALDLNAVVAEAVKMFGRLIGEDIELTTRLDPAAGQVMADPGQLHQVLMNLAVNARDAMPGGGKLIIETGNVTVSADLAGQYHELVPGSYVFLGVTDTGTGMNEEVKMHLFEPFFTTKANKGTGLGLAMVHGIVRQAGGWIGVTSEPGRGSSFHIYLPRLTTADAVHPVTSALGPAPRGLETVLVVEDQDAVRKFASTVLESCGYHVLQASEGHSAIALARSYPETIHVLLTDVVLPLMNGRAVADEIHKTRPEIKVLYTSGYAKETIGSHGMLDAGLTYLPKPFSPDQLAAKVREVLSARNRPARILIADDEAGVRGFLRRVLEGAGYEVIEAADGKQALRELQAGSLDLVIMDLVMPGQGGAETIMALRKEAAGIRIIVMSGAFEGKYLEAARNFGAQAVLTKPVSPDMLLAEVAEALMPRP